MDKRDYFIALSFGVFGLLPVTVAAIIFLLDSSVAYFSLFLVLLEIPFVVGIISTVKNKHVLVGVMFVGLFFSYIQANSLSLKFSSDNLSTKIVSFLLYQWAWLAMFQAGLEISLEKIDHLPLLNAMTIAFASVGAICWFWFGYIF